MMKTMLMVVMMRMMMTVMLMVVMMRILGRLGLSGQRSIETDRSIQGCIALNWYLVHFTRGGC